MVYSVFTLIAYFKSSVYLRIVFVRLIKYIEYIDTLHKNKKREKQIMNYKELQAKVKRLAEETNQVCPKLNSKKEVLEAELTRLEAIAIDIAIAEVVQDKDNQSAETLAKIANLDPNHIEMFAEDEDELLSTSDQVATVLAATASDVLDIAIPVAEKIAKVVGGFTLLTIASLVYFAWCGWGYAVPRVKSIAIPAAKRFLMESVHRIFYYSQSLYKEALQIKGLILDAIVVH